MRPLVRAGALIVSDAKAPKHANLASLKNALIYMGFFRISSFWGFRGLHGVGMKYVFFFWRWVDSLVLSSRWFDGAFESLIRWV